MKKEEDNSPISKHDTLSHFLKYSSETMGVEKTETPTETGDLEETHSADLNQPLSSTASSNLPSANKNLDISKKKKKSVAVSKKSNISKTPSSHSEKQSGLLHRFSKMTTSAFRIARKTTDTSLKVGKVLIDSQDQLRLMLAAGQSLKDLREVAGLTINELSESINLKDRTLLSAVENGTSTLSFELILRLASLLARNDPIPFIIKYTRAYSPETWRVLTDWGLGRIPLQYEREREFINIYRSHDDARKLSDEGFKKVLGFTRTAFEMSLHFIAEQEQISPEKEGSYKNKTGKPTKKSSTDK